MNKKQTKAKKPTAVKSTTTKTAAKKTVAATPAPKNSVSKPATRTSATRKTTTTKPAATKKPVATTAVTQKDLNKSVKNFVEVKSQLRSGEARNLAFKKPMKFYREHSVEEAVTLLKSEAQAKQTPTARKR